jgi:2-ketocyclohexanecarboxyl-CoA hydrolase
MNYGDILYDARDGTARIAINRCKRLNAFGGRTCEELIHALQRAGSAKDVGVKE